MPFRAAYRVCISACRCQLIAVVRYRKFVTSLSRNRRKRDCIAVGENLVALIVTVRILVRETVRSVKHGNHRLHKHTGSQSGVGRAKFHSQSMGSSHLHGILIAGKKVIMLFVKIIHEDIAACGWIFVVGKGQNFVSLV